jgi:hypothetical protein
MVDEPWYVARVAWDVVCKALLPVRLRDLNEVLIRFIAHLRRANERRTRPRQRDIIRKLLGQALPA